MGEQASYHALCVEACALRSALVLAMSQLRLSRLARRARGLPSELFLWLGREFLLKAWLPE